MIKIVFPLIMLLAALNTACAVGSSAETKQNRVQKHKESLEEASQSHPQAALANPSLLAPIPTASRSPPESILPVETQVALPIFRCSGNLIQAGLIQCQTEPLTIVRVEGPSGQILKRVRASATGLLIIGLSRDEGAALNLVPEGTGLPALRLDIAPRKDEISIVKGFDCDKVEARTQAQIAHAEFSATKKAAAFAIFSQEGFAGSGNEPGFILPAEGKASSPFGATRRYVGTGQGGKPCEKLSVHYGYDLAVPIGTPISAPAVWTIILADPDLYYEGGAIFLDHGNGLVSVFMHLSKLEVKVGQRVEKGQLLGLSGNTGRTTGPHLHWAVKWRNAFSEDRAQDFYIDPALLVNAAKSQP